VVLLLQLRSNPLFIFLLSTQYRASSSVVRFFCSRVFPSFLGSRLCWLSLSHYSQGEETIPTQCHPQHQIQHLHLLACSLVGAGNPQNWMENCLQYGVCLFSIEPKTRAFAPHTIIPSSLSLVQVLFEPVLFAGRALSVCACLEDRYVFPVDPRSCNGVMRVERTPGRAPASIAQRNELHECRRAQV